MSNPPASSDLITAVCGHCGYSVRGLTTFTCPECGSDLREVGIHRPGTARPSPWMLVLKLAGVVFACWVLLLLLLLLVKIIVPGNINVPGLMQLVFLLPLAAWIAGSVVLIRRHLRARVPDPPPTRSGPSERVPTPRARTLTVVFIDMQGYTALTATASRKQLSDQLEQIRQLVVPILHQHAGTLVKTVGDGFIASFESPTDALLAGQQILGAATEAHAPLRVGAATGEVVLQQDDLFGDAVNLASRIQQLASTNQVYFAESTYHAMVKSEVSHEDAGLFEIKGFTAPVRLFRTMAPVEPA